MGMKDLGKIRKHPIASGSVKFKEEILEALGLHAEGEAASTPVQARKGPKTKPPSEGSMKKSLKKFIFNGKIEEYEIPRDRWYRFVAKGAKAANGQSCTGGFGAVIDATFLLKKGDKLEILCGGMSTTSGRGDSGGGGGTFMAINGRKNPLIVAGGGGGTRGSRDDRDGKPASLEPAGSDGTGGSSGTGKGGVDGAGGRRKEASYGGGGGGFFRDGDDPGQEAYDAGGRSFATGGKGSYCGGFGGGGGCGSAGGGFACGGGGGGYSGGGAGHSAGGGGSFVRQDGVNIVKVADHSGHGELEIFIAS